MYVLPPIHRIELPESALMIFNRDTGKAIGYTEEGWSAALIAMMDARAGGYNADVRRVFVRREILKLYPVVR